MSAAMPMHDDVMGQCTWAAENDDSYTWFVMTGKCWLRAAVVVRGAGWCCVVLDEVWVVSCTQALVAQEPSQLLHFVHLRHLSSCVTATPRNRQDPSSTHVCDAWHNSLKLCANRRHMLPRMIAARISTFTTHRSEA